MSLSAPLASASRASASGIVRFSLPLVFLVGCSSNRVLRLENEVLAARNLVLQAEIERYEEASEEPAGDFVTRVSFDVLEDYLERAGFRGVETVGELLTVPITGTHTQFRLTIQYFEREKVIYIATHDYLRVDEAVNSQATVLLLTQLATLNYELLLGKFQLNPRSGAIALSVELNVDDGLGYRTFASAVTHLARTADERYPQLRRAAEGHGI